MTKVVHVIKPLKVLQVRSTVVNLRLKNYCEFAYGIFTVPPKPSDIHRHNSPPPENSQFRQPSGHVEAPVETKRTTTPISLRVSVHAPRLHHFPALFSGAVRERHELETRGSLQNVRMGILQLRCRIRILTTRV